MYKYSPTIPNDPALWNLPGAEFKLYAAILSFANRDGSNAFPSNATLGKMLGVDPRTIRRQIANLIDAGVISREVVVDPVKGSRRIMTANFVAVIGRGKHTFESTDEEGRTSESYADMDDLNGRVEKSYGGRAPQPCRGRAATPPNQQPFDQQPFDQQPKTKEETPLPPKQAGQSPRGSVFLEPFETQSTATLPEPKAARLNPACADLAAQIAKRTGKDVAGGWAAGMIFKGIDPNDWRLAEVLTKVAGGNASPSSWRYFEAIWANLPAEKPVAAQPAAPERILSKDGKYVKKNGEWLQVATPYENQPPLGYEPPQIWPSDYMY